MSPRHGHRPYEESVTNVGRVQTVRPKICVTLMVDIFDAIFSENKLKLILLDK